MASPAGRLRSAAPIGLAAYLLLIGAALATSAVPGFPWEVLLVALYLWCAWRSGWAWRASPSPGSGSGATRGWLGDGAAAAVVAAALNVLFYGVVVALGLAGPTQAVNLPGALVAVFLLGPLVGLLTTALPEEALMRGFFQRSLRVWLGTGGAVVVSAVLFSLAHLPNRTRGHLPPPGYLLWSSARSPCSACS
jgi:CAAX protease family protein